MNKNIVLFPMAFTVIFLQSYVVLSQELKFKQWEVGTDLLWLLDKDKSKPITFFARRLRTKQKTKGFGYRKFGYRIWLGFSLRNYNNNRTSQPLNTNFRKYIDKSYLIYNRLGYQWISKKNKINIIYGFDIVNRYFYNQSIRVAPSSSPQFHNHVNFDKLFRVGLSPFAGLSYHITSKIKISAESNVDFSYFIQKIKMSPTAISNGETITRRIRGFNLNPNPLYTINIGFVF